MYFCDYGCGKEATHQFKNGKWCCNKTTSKCIEVKRLIGKKSTGRDCTADTRKKLSECAKRRKVTKELREKIRIGKIGDKNPMKNYKWSNSQKIKISKKLKGRVPWNKDKKYTLKDYHKNYPFLCKVEELRELNNGDIQGHCKNHNCSNSKEQGGWFTLKRKQINQRRIQLEHPEGNGGGYFYCSDKCKEECPLYNLQPFLYIKSNNEKKYYTSEEYNIYRLEVLKRANYKCEYCGENATHVHHSRPQKLEPFFSLDPDYSISCCKNCHYEKGHKDECSTGQLSKIICK